MVTIFFLRSLISPLVHLCLTTTKKLFEIYSLLTKRLFKLKKENYYNLYIKKWRILYWWKKASILITLIFH